MDLKESISTPEMGLSSQSPPPNPPFVFPSRPMSASTPRAAGRRPRSAIEVPGQPLDINASKESRPLGSPALPSFSFNPGASLTPRAGNDDFLSPPRSPQSPHLSPSRSAHGHKRGGSEFVGGEYRSGSARMELLTSSPTEPDSTASPTMPHSEPPQRRGPAHRHAHRRSAAMSSHDLNAVLGLNLPKNPSEMARGSSAPSSPAGAELNKHFSFPLLRPDEQKPQPEIAQEQIQDMVPAETPAQSPPPVERLPTERKSFTKARVGFSDTLEFIPRPLSLVSSDASSVATVRPGHSVSGSISSIISISNSIIFEESAASLEAASVQSGSRPSTAGAVLDRTQSQVDGTMDTIAKRRGSMSLLADIELPSPAATSSANPSPTRYPKKWSFFGLDHFPGSSSPSKSRPASLNSCEVVKESGVETTPVEMPVTDTQIAQLPSPVEKSFKKSGKKQKKVKKWAGSILTKAPKRSTGKGKKAIRRGPTPPPRRDEDDDEDNASDSADTKSEPTMPTLMIEELDDRDQEGMEAWKPPRPATEDDTSFPMIDLDAALGPFNTPLPRNAEWEAAQKAGGLVKRQLHSAAGMSRFSGPGMHYTNHQRAQSSPEMPPFEFRRGISRFGSSSTMADVFEEEEEEDEDSDNGKASGSSTPQAESTGVKDSEASSVSGYFSARASAEKMSDNDVTPVAKRKAIDTEDVKLQRSSSMKSRTSFSSLQDQVIVEEDLSGTSPSFRTVEFGRPAQQQRLIAAPDSPMSSPVSPRVPLESSSSHTTASSLAPISPYSTTASSSFPSPRSLLYDGNIISTAPSSVTDDSFQSLLMGEPGPEVRKSLDVPSLASSHSTQPRENLFAQHAANMTRPPAPGERPASFSVMGFGNRRGSLASLSRLISSSHGERSKLSLEVTCNSDSEKKSKGSKTKRRLSRMQFWKAKAPTPA